MSIKLIRAEEEQFSLALSGIEGGLGDLSNLVFNPKFQELGLKDVYERLSAALEELDDIYSELVDE